MMITKCNGVQVPRERFSQPSSDLIVSLLPDIREAYIFQIREKTHEIMAIDGSRFNSDSTVIATIESAYSEDDFLKMTHMVITDALIDCAQRDYYYAYEKTYGDMPTDTNEEDS